jgi:hypothetical protein
MADEEAEVFHEDAFVLLQGNGIVFVNRQHNLD